MAGPLAAPLQQLAGLLQALPRNLAYGLAALRDQRLAESGDLVAEPAEPAAPDAGVAAGAQTPGPGRGRRAGGGGGRRTPRSGGGSRSPPTPPNPPSRRRLP